MSNSQEQYFQPGFWGYKFWDARGQRVKKPRLGRIKLALRPDQRGMYEQDRRRERQWTFALVPFCIGMALILPAIVLVFVVEFWFDGALEKLFKLLGYTVLGAGSGTIGAYCIAPGWFNAVIRCAIRYNVCPQCTFDMSGAQLHDDGCIVCPECGAAWRLPADANNPA